VRGTVEELGVKEEQPPFLPRPPSWHLREILGDWSLSPMFFLWHRLFSFVISLVRSHFFGTGLGGG